MGNHLPRPEYPRPQWHRAEWLNLNGEWGFREAPAPAAGASATLPEAQFAGRIVVPFAPESRLSGIGKTDFMPCVWYCRSFTLPEAWEGRRVWLHFGAVDYETSVWVNGEPVGGHRGGYTPFALEVTERLRGGENELVVRALDDTRSPLQPSGKQSDRQQSYGCFYTRTTGIWQTVWLEPTPRAFVERARLTPDVASGRLFVEAWVRGPAEGLRLAVSVRAGTEEVAAAQTPAAGGMSLLCLQVEDPRLWSPEDPFLYDLEFTLAEGDRVVDRVESYCGMREIELEGPAILLNGRPVFQRLILDQGYYPDGVYTAPSDGELRGDIELAQAMGFNGARLHQKVFDPRFLYWADRLGYLCWGEYADWGFDHSRPEALEVFLPEWLEAVARDANHPSIVGWCPFNETRPEQRPELLRQTRRITKLVDPTRPVIDASGYIHVETDVDDCHTYEQDPAKFAALFEEFAAGGRPYRSSEMDEPHRGQPYFVSEYGGIWWNPKQADEKGWGYGERPRSEREFLDRYRALTESLLAHPRMCGFCYTQLTDVEQEVNGLYTYDRRPKFDPAAIRAVNERRAAIER